MRRGHQFWYGIVGSNEFEHAWMDEGINTFSEARTTDEAGFANHLTARFFGGFVPWVLDDISFERATDGNRLSGYRRSAEADTPSTPSFRYWPGTATGISYNKTALWLHTLERRLGWPVLQRILSTHFDRWKFRHPQPADFFAVVNEVSGRDMTWFFDQVHRGSNTFDYGVQRFTSTQVRPVPGADTDEVPAAILYRTLVVVQRLGEAVFPVDVVTTLRDGERITEPLGRTRPSCHLHLRATVAGTVGAGGPRACPTARRGLYKQQRHSRATRGRGRPQVEPHVVGLAAGLDADVCVFRVEGVERSGD